MHPTQDPAVPATGTATRPHRRHSLDRWGRPISVLGLVVAATLAPTSARAMPSTGAVLTSAVVRQLSTGDAQRMIVVLRDQVRDLALGDARRAAAVRADQSGVRHDLGQLHASGVRSLDAVDAVAARLTSAEAAWLRTRADVAAVVPDRRLTQVRADGVDPAHPAGTAPAAEPSVGDTTCPSDPAQPLVGQDLTLTHTMSPTGSTAAAAQDLATGRDVRVGMLEAGDNLDPDSPEFVRSDGSHVVVEDRSYGSSDTDPSFSFGGQEAFGDVSAVGAQGHGRYDVSTYGLPQHPLPAGCMIKIRGMAPDANLYVADFTFTSEAIAAIDHLVADDRVDVISESFLYAMLPDDPGSDPLMLANEAAVRSGVTITVASADGGIDSTQDSPAADPGVIDVGATTAGRLYQQVQSAAFTFSNGEAENNQPASLSSDGYATATPRVLDVVAPGDGSWNACTPSPDYPACVNLTGAPSAFRAFRGTSESAPLTAGEAALVIERFRATHGGSSPSPQQVKAFIMSSAHDLGLPARLQGAGLIDSLAAVRLAGSSGGLVADDTALAITAAPGTSVTRSVTVTNASAQTSTVRPLVQDHQTIAAETSTVTLDPYHDPRFFCAAPSSGITRTIHVPSGADQLTIEAAGKIDPAEGPQQAPIALTLIDPSGRWANWSSPALPSAAFAHIEEARPEPGAWTVVVWTGQDEHGWHGDVTLHWQASRLVTVSSGAVRTIRPGESASVPVTFSVPRQAGDSDVRLAIAGGANTPIVPVVLRTQLRFDGGDAEFAGRFTGIRGSTANGSTQQLTYAIPVRSPRSLEVDLHLSSLTMVHAYLVDPAHDLVAERTNCVDPEGHHLVNDLVMYADRPASGTWLLVLELDRSHATATGYDNPFTGVVRTDSIAVSSNGLPHSTGTVIPAGSTRTATISVTNTGAQQQSFSTDARLDHETDLPLVQLGAGTVSMPTTDFSTLPTWLVPPGTTRLQVTGVAGSAIDFDLFPLWQQDPDVPSSVGTTAVASVERPQLPPALWSLTGDVVDSADSGTSAAFSATAHTAAFDPEVHTSTGDAWLIAVDPAAPAPTPVVVPAGATGNVTVSFTPHGAPGTVVRGTLFIDMGDCVAGVGDTVTALPYAYTVG
ncbi:MAG TPA: S8 family serine peptidase [Marmoricola sp.]|nr:S8 family serine peptidase [Marmoricola sp.]